jgi:site-specific recombinase XerD
MAAPPPLRRLTVAEAATEYLRDVERAVLGGSLSPSTQANYQRDLQEFTALAGSHVILDDLSATDVDDIVLAYAATPDKRYTKRAKPGEPGSPGRGPGAQVRFRQSVSRLFTYAERRGLVQRNPMPDTVVRPKVRDRATGARTALPQPSAEALLEVPGTLNTTSRKDQRLSVRDTAILRILLEVGPRVSELAGMDRTDFTKIKDDWWLIVRSGKGGKRRGLPLSPATAEALHESLAQARPTPPPPATETVIEDAQRALFVTFRGRRMTPRDIQNLVDRTSRRLPPDVRRRATPHGLRHTAATLLIASGAADVSTVQHLLGHASLATTGIYLDPISDEMVRAVAAHPVTGGPHTT